MLSKTENESHLSKTLLIRTSLSPSGPRIKKTHEFSGSLSNKGASRP